VEAGIRSYAVDCTPHHQQDTTNAWMSRMVGMGNIFGMFCGGLDLPKVLPFLGHTQFKGLSAIAAICMGVACYTSVATIPERDPRQDPEHPNANESLVMLFRSLWKSASRLPPQIVKICRVQFLSWMGWFPFLYYTTTYVGEIYVQPFLEANPDMSADEVDRLWEAGTRRGTMALLLFAIVTLTTSVILPFLVPPHFKLEPAIPESTTPRTLVDEHTKLSTVQSFVNQLLSNISTLLTKLQISSLTLRRTWLYSHLFFCACMWSTITVRSVPIATGLISLVGIPWAITMWAPYALISAEISKRDAIRRGVIAPPPTHDGALLAANEDDAADQAGIVLGIHNVAVSAPQVIATVVGSLLFKWLQKERGQPGDESVAWFFRLGGICALYAAWLTRKVGEEGGKTQERGPVVGTT
jgi:solute carrier family 45, member 1/2/4